MIIEHSKWPVVKTVKNEALSQTAKISVLKRVNYKIVYNESSEKTTFYQESSRRRNKNLGLGLSLETVSQRILFLALV